MPELYLFSDGSGLLVSSGGELTADPDCCCGRQALAIAICNSNAARDDNFKVLLNDNEIGTIDNSTNACTGRIFATDSSVTNFSGLACNSAFEPTVQLSEQDLIEGTNTLRIESTQDNNNGNFGTVQVVRIQYDGSVWNVVQSYLNDTYSFPDGVGEGDDYTFEYP